MLSRVRLWAPYLAWQAQDFGDASAENVAGAASGSCLKGWGVVARAAVGAHPAWQAQHFGDASAEVMAGAILRPPGLAFAWQGQRLGAV